MSMINLSLKHGRSLEDARKAMDSAVVKMRGLFGTMIRTVDWSTDRNRVRIEGQGFWIEMTVDPMVLHATGDIPGLGGLLGGPLASGLKQIVQQSFQKKLP